MQNTDVGVGQPSPARSLEEHPFAWDALEGLGATRLEHKAGTSREVLDGARDEHFTRPGERADPGRNVDGDARDIRTGQLDLARMEPSPDSQPVRRDRVTNGEGTTNRPGRPVERRKEPVAGRLHLVPSKPFERRPSLSVVLPEKPAPFGITKLGGARGRPDEDGEEDGRKDPVGLDDRVNASAVARRKVRGSPTSSTRTSS